MKKKNYKLFLIIPYIICLLALLAFPTVTYAASGDEETTVENSNEESTSNEESSSEGEESSSSVNNDDIKDLKFYVCFSTENYAVRNSNLMKFDGNYFVLEEVKLDNTISFYVSNGSDQRYYNSKNKEMTVKETGVYTYNIYFSPKVNFTGDDLQEGMCDSKCHITYSFYTHPTYNLMVNEQEVSLSYNDYNAAYDCYYVTELELNKDDVLTVVDNEGNVLGYELDSTDGYTVEASGIYRFLFTPKKEKEGKVYAFNSNGVYGSGDDYKYSYYIEDARELYVAFRTPVSIRDDNTVSYNDLTLYKLNKDETVVANPTFLSNEFFVGQKNYKVKYEIYEYNRITDCYTLIDDDNDDSTVVSSIEVNDVGWYKLSFQTISNVNKTTVNYEEREFDDYYLAGNFNNYCYDEFGEVDLSDSYKLLIVEDNEDSKDIYNEDYDQYIIILNVTSDSLRHGDIIFYITDGKTKYKNGSDYITIKTKGEYQIIFSPSHNYGLGRNYKYSIIESDIVKEEVIIGSVDDFKEFIANCNYDSDYSTNRVFNLVSDLNFAGVNLDAITVFNGEFNGHYHTIYNLYLSNSNGKDNIGLFIEVTKDASISDLYLRNFVISAEDSNYVGFICKNYGALSNVTLSGSITGRSYVGGVVAYNGNYGLSESDSIVDSQEMVGYGTLKNITNNANVYGLVNVGGVIGFNGGKAIKVTNNGNVNDKFYSSTKTLLSVGGISGYSTGTFIECKNYGNVGYNNIASFVGGISGLSIGSFYYCMNYGVVLGYDCVGGLIGYYGNISNNADDKNQFSDLDYEKLINDFFQNSDNSDSYEANEQDLKQHLLTYCINNSQVTATSNAGGIIGSNNVTDLLIKNSISSGDISCINGNYVGGIVGSLNGGSVKSSASTGTIIATGSAKGSYVGGISGYTKGDINYCASSTVIKGINYVGGLTGYIEEGNIISSYTNVLLVPAKDATFIGLIAGDTGFYNEAKGSFNDHIKFNYYIGDEFGGINNINYQNKDLYEAVRISMDDLISNTSLSPKLANGFDREYFVGGLGEYTYPYIRSFDEVDIEDNFEASLDFETIYNKYEELFLDFENEYLQASISITFLEWNSDNGDNDDYDAFEINKIYRVFYGQEMPLAPDYMYAKLIDSRYVYETKTNSYFVSWNKLSDKFENQNVYASYSKAVTSIEDKDKTILVSGLFFEGTNVSLERIGDYYKVVFTCNGSEIEYSNYDFKMKLDKNQEYYVVGINGSQEEHLDAKFMGDYLEFDCANYNVFKVSVVSNDMPSWGYLVIGILNGLVVTVIVVLVIKMVKGDKKSKKDTKDEEITE